jgi:hypothetical protein
MHIRVFCPIYVTYDAGARYATAFKRALPHLAHLGWRNVQLATWDDMKAMRGSHVLVVTMSG